MKNSILRAIILFTLALNPLLLLAGSRGDDFIKNQIADEAIKRQLRDAAYFGDLDFLKTRFGDSNSDKGTVPVLPSELIGEAVAGHQYDVIQWCANRDPDANKISGWFCSKQMDLKAAKIIVEAIPALKTNYCNKTLDGAILGDNVEVLKFLLALGIRPANQQQPPSPLGLATQLRRLGMISLLIKHGANPYEKSNAEFSPVEYAIAIKSAGLLKALDRDKKYSDDLARINNELTPPPHSPFAGTWADLHEGFGSISITLNPDGTGSFGSDIGGMPAIWKLNGNTARFILLEGGSLETMRPNEKQAIDLKIAGKDLVMTMGGHERHLKSYDTAAPNEKLLTRRPYNIQVEKAHLAKANDLYLQINGRLLKFSIAKLIAQSQEDADEGSEPNKNNIVFWDNFKKGSIPNSFYNQSFEVACTNKGVRTQYHAESECTKVMFESGQLAIVPAGFNFALFPLDSLSYYHNPRPLKKAV